MSPEMKKDTNYTTEQWKDDRSEVLACLLGKMTDIAGKTSNENRKELLEYLIDFVDVDIETRYQKRKK